MFKNYENGKCINSILQTKGVEGSVMVGIFFLFNMCLIG